MTVKARIQVPVYDMMGQSMDYIVQEGTFPNGQTVVAEHQAMRKAIEDGKGITLRVDPETWKTIRNEDISGPVEFTIVEVDNV